MTDNRTQLQRDSDVLVETGQSHVAVSPHSRRRVEAFRDATGKTHNTISDSVAADIEALFSEETEENQGMISTRTLAAYLTQRAPLRSKLEKLLAELR